MPAAEQHRRQRPQLLTDPDKPAGRHLAVAAPSAEQVVLDLPPQMRTAVLLVDVDELSYAEASALLGVPEGTLTSRLHRGRKRIHRRVQAAGLTPRRQR